MSLRDIALRGSTEPLSLIVRKRLDDLVTEVCGLIESGQDVFSMNRYYLARALGVRQTMYQRYYELLAKELERRYGQTPVFATSQRAAKLKEYAKTRKRVSDEYHSLVKACPKLKPSVGEIVRVTNMPRQTIVEWCKRLKLSIDSSHTYHGARHLIRGLNNIPPDKFTSDDVLMRQFPNDSMRQIRKYIEIVYESRFLPKSARPYVLFNNIIYNLLRGYKPANAIRFAGIGPRDLASVLEITEGQRRAERWVAGQVLTEQKPY